MYDCLTVENTKLKMMSSPILSHGDNNTIFQQGYGNNSCKHKTDDINHSLPDHTPPLATTISNKISNQLKSFPGQGSRHLSENIDIAFCGNNETKAQVNGGSYLLHSKY
jgi:hypothetical protein